MYVISKPAAVVFIYALLFPPFQFYNLPKGQLFLLICFFISLVSINKQLSIDSYLDWEGHHWDYLLSCSSRHHSQFPPSVQLLPTHLTRYRYLLFIWGRGALLYTLKMDQWCLFIWKFSRSELAVKHCIYIYSWKGMWLVSEGVCRWYY